MRIQDGVKQFANVEEVKVSQGKNNTVYAVTCFIYLCAKYFMFSFVCTFPGVN